MINLTIFIIARMVGAAFVVRKLRLSITGNSSVPLSKKKKSDIRVSGTISDGLIGDVNGQEE